MKQQNRRILLVDDNPAIHEDFKKILVPPSEGASDYFGAKTLLFGSDSSSSAKIEFQIDSAYQGQQGFQMVQQAAAEGRPYAMAFVDVRMPPGWDGIETITRIWEKYSDMQIAICTAYSDYSWDDMQQRFGSSDNLLILKKPFDNVEVLQLAHALTAKWNVTRAANTKIDQLDQMVAERTRELQSSEERFSKIFRNNPVPMFFEAVAGERVLDVNPAFLKLVDREREIVVGRPISELNLWHDTEATTTPEILARVNDGQTTQILTSKGEERNVLLFAEQFEAGEELCRLVLLQDITERLKLESDLRQAHKMEAIGQLAAGVAHDFNNILTIVQGHLSLVRSRDHLEPHTLRALTQALTASERAGALTQQLLAFSRKQVMQRKPLKLSSLFEQFEAMIQRLIGDQIEIHIECPDDLPRVYADHCNIEQVLLNLAVNARDAMPNGGKLTIEAFEARPDCVAAGPHANPEALDGTFVCIRVTDTGFGMDEATKARIFEPFFTTKDVGKGTGMGLATVYGILKQHQGGIEVESALGKGTTFRVYLPVSIEIADTTILRKPSTSPAAAKGDETILVVEDEEMLLEFVQEVLASHGYRVLTATNAMNALKVWERESNIVALLLTDMVMPGGVSGKQLADKLKSQKPDLRVIYSSGYSLELVGGEALQRGISLLRKPYPASLLVKTVRDCLDARNDNRDGVGAERSVHEIEG
jgi:PAS domain S-box-containing protein